jgi:hypothetical protein
MLIFKSVDRRDIFTWETESVTVIPAMGDTVEHDGRQFNVESCIIQDNGETTIFYISEKKYYHVYTKCESGRSIMEEPQCFVTDRHPFEVVAEYNDPKMNYPGKTYLISWQQITKAEYDRYSELYEKDLL